METNSSLGKLFIDVLTILGSVFFLLVSHHFKPGGKSENSEAKVCWVLLGYPCSLLVSHLERIPIKIQICSRNFKY